MADLQDYSSSRTSSQSANNSNHPQNDAYDAAGVAGATNEMSTVDQFNGNEMLASTAVNAGASRPFANGARTMTPHPKKELIENIKHGTSVFPFASYLWVPQNYPSRVTLHWHPEMELVRFTRGTFKVSIDMQDTVIQDDAFLLLPGNVMHTFTFPAFCEESAVVFDPRMLMFQNFDEVQSEIFGALISGNIPLPPVITPEHPAFERIDKLYRYCARHGATTNASHRLMIKAKLTEILAIYHEYGLITSKDVHSNLKRSKQDKLKDLLNYINGHYAGPMSIKDAASRLGVTDQYFCRFFKRVTGMSFTEYLNDLRLRRAAKTIELTSRAISEIAYENGFENAGYFFKSFKSKYGITPLKYRKRFLKELNSKGKTTAAAISESTDSVISVNTGTAVSTSDYDASLVERGLANANNVADEFYDDEQAATAAGANANVEAAANTATKATSSALFSQQGSLDEGTSFGNNHANVNPSFSDIKNPLRPPLNDSDTATLNKYTTFGASKYVDEDDFDEPTSSATAPATGATTTGAPTADSAAASNGVTTATRKVRKTDIASSPAQIVYANATTTMGLAADQAQTGADDSAEEEDEFVAATTVRSQRAKTATTTKSANGITTTKRKAVIKPIPSPYNAAADEDEEDSENTYDNTRYGSHHENKAKEAIAKQLAAAEKLRAAATAALTGGKVPTSKVAAANSSDDEEEVEETKETKSTKSHASLSSITSLSALTRSNSEGHSRLSRKAEIRAKIAELEQQQRNMRDDPFDI